MSFKNNDKFIKNMLRNSIFRSIVKKLLSPSVQRVFIHPSLSEFSISLIPSISIEWSTHHGGH